MVKADKVESLFPKDLTDRERAAFELGIKLGALFHMSMGIPISKNKDVIQSLENGLEKSISCQPYVNLVKVKIISSAVHGHEKKENEFDYSSINPQCLSAEISLKYKNVTIEGKLNWDDELKFPIMSISKIS